MTIRIAVTCKDLSVMASMIELGWYFETLDRSQHLYAAVRVYR